MRASATVGDLTFGVNAVQETLTVALVHALNARYLDYVYASHKHYFS